MAESDRDLFLTFGQIAKGLKRWLLINLPDGAGMTVPRASVLMVLAGSTGPVAMKDIGESSDLSPRTMTVVVDGLEKEGWVRRSQHPRDRRVTLLELTGEGRSMAHAELVPATHRAMVLFEHLTPEDKTDLRRVLDVLRSKLAEHGIK